jgi:hypothetical protein
VTAPGQGQPDGGAEGPALRAAAAGPGGGDQAPVLGPGEQIAGAEGHVCLGCGCRIAQGVREVRVPFRGRRSARYRHADSGGCADALRAPQPNNSWIGRYEALSTFRWDPNPAGRRPQGSAG